MIISTMLLAATAAMAATGGLDVYADGKTVHRLESPSGAKVPLSYRRSEDGGKTWSKPVPVDGGRIAYRFGAGDARVVADGAKLYALWTRPGKGPYGSGPLAVAVSADGGKTWTSGASPAADGDTGRRFPALAAAGGVVHAFWLDRATNAKLLSSYSSDGAKTWSKPVIVDEDVCECCWNSALTAGGATYVLYRDRNPRDMGVAVTRDGGKTWSKPERAGAFGWGFDGCPHVGGALASAAGKIWALVWTGKSEDAGLYAFSSPDGVVWTKSARLGGAGAKHGDLSAGAAGLSVVWDEDGAVWAATSADGASWKTRKIGDGGHPRVAGGKAYWAEKDAAL